MTTRDYVIHGLALQCSLTESLERALVDGFSVCSELEALNEGVLAKSKNIFAAGLIALASLAGSGCDAMDKYERDKACGHYIQSNAVLDSRLPTSEAIKKYHLDTDDGKQRLLDLADSVAGQLYMTNAEGEMGASYIRKLATKAKSPVTFKRLASAVEVGQTMLNSISTGKCADGLDYEEKDIDKYPYAAKQSTDDSFMEPSIGFSNGKLGFGFGSGVPGFNAFNIDDF